MEKSINSLFDKTKFKSKKELYGFLIENKDTLIAQKKAVTKFADGISIAGKSYNATKANATNEMLVKVVINTTNIMDSHDDVHLNGIWDKSLSENKSIMHLQEHQMQFDKIIADGQDLKAYTQEYTWKDLGYNYEGKTQALVFDSVVRSERNKFMFDQYNKGRVNNHSVGMRYIKFDLAVDDDDYPNEKAAFDKYIDIIANKEEVKEQGFFFYVKEAKVIEGSAVPMGSNFATPTLEAEPLEDTQDNEPKQFTQQQLKEIFRNELKSLL
jgi:hypothetical protein